MLLFLLQAVVAVEQLTTSSFQRMVDNRKRHEVWMVMFTGQTCPACKMAYPQFEEASKLSGGMVRFGVIDIHRSLEISERFDCRMIPQFRIFHAKGDSDYVGNRQDRSFLNSAISYIEDFTEPVDASWEGSLVAKPAAILFTDKAQSPAIWSAVSSYFHGKSVRVGLCSDEELQTQYGVTSVPEVRFMNGTASEVYKGKVDFKGIRQAMEVFFAKRLEMINQEVGGSFYDVSRFEELCLGGRQNCIVCGMDKATEEMERLARTYARRKLLWFTGTEALPYDFLRSGGVWFYNPRRDGFVRVQNEEDIETTMESMLDGVLKWTKRDVLMRDL